MSKPIFCEHCHKPIEDKEDLIVASLFFRIKPYHFFCYGNEVRGARSVFLTSHPLNGGTGMISYLLLILLTAALFLFTNNFIKYIALIYLIIETSLRIFAFVKFTRKIKH